MSTPPSVTDRRGWDTVVVAGVVVFALGCIVTMVVLSGSLIPPLVILPVLLAVAFVVGRRRQRVGAIALVVLAVVSLIGNAPFLLDDLAHPAEAPAQFAVSLAMFVGLLAVLVGAVSTLRSADDRAARTVLAAAAAVVVVGVVAAGIMSTGNDSDTAQSGDTTIVAKDVAFTPRRVTVAAGGGVLVDNRDLVRHTFTVDDQGVRVSIPAGHARRVSIDLEPGTYAFHCEVPGHDDMIGTLVVD